MITNQIFGYKNEAEYQEVNTTRDRQKKAVIGEILWTLHEQQGTQLWLIQAIEPYLRKEDRPLFGLV